MKTLVVYYSRKGQTENIALRAAEECGADFLNIEPIDSVAGYDGFIGCALAAFSRKKMTLFPYDEDIASYEKVIICSPVWFGKISAPMLSFMETEKHNISSAEYILVHALPVNACALADEADKILRIKKGGSVRSVQTLCGHILKDESLDR